MLRAFASTARRARVVRVFQEVTGTVTHETTPGHIMSNRAWVTLATNDSYGLGALVLAHSLRRVNSVYPTVVLITPSVTEAMRNRLSAVFAEVITVDVLDSRDAAHLALLQRPELGITFTKIHCWTLTQYEKCVFLDADTLIVQNCDELFEREELSAAPDVGWPDCFNSGVFVFVPSNETYSRLITFAKERGSFDGGDQGLLNAFFSDWARGDINKHLPFLYNVTSAAFYSYLPALKHYGQDLKIIHFIGNAKPWLQSFNWESRSVDAPEHLQQFLQQWWDVFVGQVHPQLDTAMGLAVEVEEALPETTPPEVPPEDVQHHYEPEIDPESEFPWHRPEAQNQQTENKPEQVDLSQIHDPWQHYRGNIPKTDYSYNQQTDFGVKQFEEELKKMAWEYQYPHQDLNRMPSSQEQIEHNIWQPPQQQHEYTQHSNHQEHIHQQVHYQHHEHHWEPHEYHHEQQHSYDHHQHSNDDHGWHYQEQHSHHSDFEKQHDHTVQSHHQHFHDHSTHTPHHVSSDHSDQHFNESHRHDNQSEIRPDRVTVQDNDYRVPEPHVISNDHSRKHSKHRSYHQHLGNKQFSPYTTQPRIEQVYHMHLDHRQNRRQCKVNNAHYSGMNGDASDSESEDEEYIVPRHPYDGFYLRHRATIDSRGHKICSHEIPPTPTPSPPPPEESRDVLSPTRSEEEFDTASECEEQYSGVAGNLARVVPGASNYQRDAIDELTRRQGWEAGNIDYMGADSFDNIWAKISQTLNQPRQSPPKQSPQKEPTPPKEPIPPKEQPQEAPAAQESPAPVEAAPVETPVAVAPVQPVPAETPAQAAPVAAPVPASSAPAAPTPETPKAEAPAAAPTQQAAKPAEVPKPVQEAVQVVAAATPQTKTEPAVPPTPPVTPKSTPEATTPVTETPVETQAAATPVETSKAAPASPAPAAEAPAVTPPKVQATPEKSESAALTTASTDSPPLAHTPSKEEVPAVPAAKSEERRKPAEKLQLRPPAPVADALPTPDSELEDAAALAQSIIAGELSVTAPSPSADPASPPAAPEAKKLSVEAPELPTPPVSLAQIGVKPKGKPTTAAQIESSVTEKAPPPEPSSPTEAPKKKVVKKGAKKEGGVGDAATPVPPPRKKEKKPKEK